MIRGRTTGAVAIAAAALLLVGCTPAPKHPVVTFKVADSETYRVELLTPELVTQAKALLAGRGGAAIPVGKVVRDSPGVNTPWSWHIDPATFHFAFATTEVCDGLPSYVEDRTITSDTYCPWSAKVVSVR